GTNRAAGPRRARLARGAGACLTAAATACGGGNPAASTPSAASAPASAAARPNFVVIIADDMAYGLFGAGRRLPFLALPNLQGLAAQGVQFDQAVVTTALCSPSRATSLSGLYSHARGARANEQQELAAHNATVPL